MQRDRKIRQDLMNINRGFYTLSLGLDLAEPEDYVELYNENCARLVRQLDYTIKIPRREQDASSREEDLVRLGFRLYPDKNLKEPFKLIVDPTDKSYQKRLIELADAQGIGIPPSQFSKLIKDLEATVIVGYNELGKNYGKKTTYIRVYSDPTYKTSDSSNLSKLGIGGNEGYQPFIRHGMRIYFGQDQSSLLEELTIEIQDPSVKYARNFKAEINPSNLRYNARLFKKLNSTLAKFDKTASGANSPMGLNRLALMVIALNYLVLEETQLKST